jgi:hypothetical protein
MLRRRALSGSAAIAVAVLTFGGQGEAQTPEAIARCRAQPSIFQALCFDAITPPAAGLAISKPKAPAKIAAPEKPQPNLVPENFRREPPADIVTPAAVAPSPAVSESQNADVEKLFVQAVIGARNEYTNALNELLQGATRPARKKELCRILHGPRIENWKGKITILTSNNDGKGVVTIEIGKDIHVTTWNNSFSDVQDHTLIEPDSEVFNQLVKMKEGQVVRFSGLLRPSNVDCVREASVTLSGSMTDPDFIVRFTALQSN